MVRARVSAAVGLADKLLADNRRLCRDLDGLHFAAPVTHVYNPLGYARRPHTQYVRRYADSPKHVVFVGMNPGPYGMAQTGVPFGEISWVRDWLGIEEPVQRPEREHPKRPVQGFACPRSEVSGARLWGAIAEHWITPARFFRRAYVANYCPLVFMEESGRNRTPDKLPRSEREPLFAACDRHLRRLIELLAPEFVVGVGRFAEDQARQALADLDLTVGTVLHPSPASPRANRGWRDQAARELRALGVCSGR